LITKTEEGFTTYACMCKYLYTLAHSTNKAKMREIVQHTYATRRIGVRCNPAVKPAKLPDYCCRWWSLTLHVH
jgi:hypothetical protein